MKTMHQNTTAWPSEKDIRDFIGGRLSASRMDEISELCKAHPILSDAIDGYREFPVLDGIQAKRTSGRLKSLTTAGALVFIALIWIGTLTEKIQHVAMRTPEFRSKLANAIVPALLSQEGKGLFEPTRKDSKGGGEVKEMEVQIRLAKPISSVEFAGISSPRSQIFGGLRLPGKTGKVISINGYHVLPYPERVFADAPMGGLIEGHVPACYSGVAEMVAEAESVQVEYNDLIESVVREMHRGHLTAAESGWKFILSNYPDDVNALFYSGITAYRAGAPDRAVHWFTESMYHPAGVFADDSHFYRALAQLDLGHRDQACRELKEISNGESFYAVQAIHRYDCECGGKQPTR